MKHLKTLSLATLFLTLLFMASPGHAQTAFTYQGQLRDGGTNANGSYSLTFTLHNAASGGAQIGGNLTAPDQSIVNGLFTVALDFGGAAFDGNARWLEITVQAGISAAETLAPRVAVLPAPYALFAKVAGTVTNGAIMNAQLAVNAIATANIQNGAITTAQIAAGAVTNANLTANAVATINILDAAVTDAKIVSVSGGKVVGNVASASSLVGGTWNVSVGNYQTYTNILRFTTAGSTVMGLYENGISVNGEIDANKLFLNGGGIQFSGQPGATMTVDNNGDFIFNNNVRITSPGNITLPAPGGSRSISANNQGITVDGISLSAANGVVIPNGDGGTVSITASGQNIRIPLGGLTLGVGGIAAAGGGSFGGAVSAGNGFFSGFVSASGSISAGSGNFSGAVSAGSGNFSGAVSAGSGVFSGSVSAGSGAFSGPVIAVGSISAGSGNFSGAVSAGSGSFGGAVSAGSGVFSGSVSAGSGAFSGPVIASGSISAGSGNFSGAVSATAFNTTSDRNVKELFTAINSRDILDRVVNLPISSWNFKGDTTTRHIGPMAQDFHAAFNVGPDDKHIATVDADGVALAAIQGLHEIVKEKDSEIAALKQRLTDLEKAVSALAKEKGGTP